jgi:hypothetical protein
MLRGRKPPRKVLFGLLLRHNSRIQSAGAKSGQGAGLPITIVFQTLHLRGGTLAGSDPQTEDQKLPGGLRLPAELSRGELLDLVIETAGDPERQTDSIEFEHAYRVA